MSKKKRISKKYGAWYCHECNVELKNEGDAFCSKCEPTHFICADCGKSYHISENKSYESFDGWLCNDCIYGIER
jgi:hypothetical protein